jgi:hypothetical protein
MIFGICTLREELAFDLPLSHEARVFNGSFVLKHHFWVIHSVIEAKLTAGHESTTNS